MTADPVLNDPATCAAPAFARPGAVTRVLLAVIGFYRVAISPMRPPACRYAPSCSEYAVEALQTWGLARGVWLAARRLLRCHPWHAGGHDPVPSRPADPAAVPAVRGVAVTGSRLGVNEC